mmetsp:Transcript_5461/g.5998  ORF Transcript_5461/g.5998 Transcript_5461/m.5998 type:complete len:107 (+) Transcript_5461:108-428(+)
MSAVRKESSVPSEIDNMEAEYPQSDSNDSTQMSDASSKSRKRARYSSEDDSKRKLSKLERNRLAAKKCRDKKKKVFERLRCDVDTLRNDKDLLSKKVKPLLLFPAS